MKLKLLFSFIIVCSVNAGNEVGNGGDAVICGNQAPVLLDFLEAQSDKSIHIVEKKSFSGDEYEYLKTIFKRLSKVSPAFSKKYLNDLKNLKKKVKFLSQKKFRDVEDSFHISVPNGCSLKQLAIQRQINMNSETIININKDIYEKMNVHNKAGLLSHEIIYEHFRYFGQRHSVNVRRFNRYIFSKDLEKDDKATFSKLLGEMRIPAY